MSSIALRRNMVLTKAFLAPGMFPPPDGRARMGGTSASHRVGTCGKMERVGQRPVCIAGHAEDWDNTKRARTRNPCAPVAFFTCSTALFRVPYAGVVCCDPMRPIASTHPRNAPWANPQSPMLRPRKHGSGDARVPCSVAWCLQRWTVRLRPVPLRRPSR